MQGLSLIPKAVTVLKKYNNLIPLTLSALDMSNEDLVHKVFEMFNEFAEIKKVLGPHLPIIIERALLIAANTEYGNNLREVAMFFLELIADNYAKTLIKNHGLAFIDKVFEVGFQIMAEDPELYEGQEESPPQMAAQMLFSYACCVHTEKVFPIIMKYMQKYAVSQNQYERAAATVMLGQVVDPEACLDHVRDNLNALTNFLIDRMSDDSVWVREVAGETVGRFSEHVGDEFTRSHKKFMPCLIRVVREMANSKHEMTVQKTLFALNEFVQHLDYDIKLYLNELIVILTGYAQSNFSRDVKYWALYTLQSVIATAQKKIIPHMNGLLEVIHGIINQQGNVGDVQLVKGQALSCAGRLASACGRDVFPAQALEVFTQFGLECLKSSEKYELKETAFTYFSDLAVLLKEDLAPVFEQVMSTILETMNAEDQQEEVRDEKRDGAKGFSLDTDSEGEGLIGMNVDIGQVDERSAAINALGIIAMHSPKLTANRMKDVLEAQERLHHHFHENVKFHVSQTYNQIALGMIRAHGLLDERDKFNWTRGPASGCPLPSDVMQYLDRIVFPYYFSVFDQEDNKEVIEKALGNLIDLTVDLGPGVFANQLEKITEYIILFLQKKTFCQGGVADVADDNEHEDEEDGGDEYGDEDEDDGIDHDEVILGNITDLIYETARSFGNDFGPYFARIAPVLVEYTSEKHPKNDKNMALGCIGEVFASAPGIISNYFADYLPLLEQNSKTKDSRVNRNIAYNLGVLAQHAPLLFQPHVQNALMLLHRMHEESEEPEAKDNIIAAFCRIVEYQFLPLPES